jgi:hypothetical protein
MNGNGKSHILTTRTPVKNVPLNGGTFASRMAASQIQTNHLNGDPDQIMTRRPGLIRITEADRGNR